LYQIEKFPLAIARLYLAITQHRQQNKPPRQNWLQMLQSMHYQLGEREASIAAVEQLLRYYPKKVYWLQLAGLHAELGRKDRQLAVLDSAYSQGFLNTENELKTLAYLLIEHKAPYPAAKILQQALEQEKIDSNEQNLRLLAGAWRQAKEIERSIDVLESAAARVEHGRIFAELAQLYLVEQQFEKAVSVSRQALEKGSLKKPGQAYNSLGIALFKLQRLNAAERAFAEAKQHPGAIKVALQWERHLQQAKRQVDAKGS
jgi:tetratricopeptide (TPR) repeat protein